MLVLSLLQFRETKHNQKMSRRYRWSLFEGDHVAEIHKKKGGKYQKISDLYIQKIKRGDDSVQHQALKNVHSKQQLVDVVNSTKLSKKKKKELLDAIDMAKDVNENGINMNGYEVTFPNNKYCLKPIKRTYPASERECIFITGVSGTGKSNWISEYITNYKVQHPDNEIVLFSNVSHDECLDKHSPIRIDLKELVNSPIDDLEELNNTCCIFDDTAKIPDKKINQAVQKLRDMILNEGRHNNISCIVTSHDALGGIQTKFPIKESDYRVIFPEGNEGQCRNMLEKYCELKGKKHEDVIEKMVDRSHSRWAAVSKGIPRIVLFKRSAIIL